MSPPATTSDTEQGEALPLRALAYRHAEEKQGTLAASGAELTAAGGQISCMSFYPFKSKDATARRW